jgi:hypothetical protein
MYAICACVHVCFRIIWRVICKRGETILALINGDYESPVFVSLTIISPLCYSLLRKLSHQCVDWSSAVDSTLYARTASLAGVCEWRRPGTNLTRVWTTLGQRTFLYSIINFLLRITRVIAHYVLVCAAVSLTHYSCARRLRTSNRFVSEHSKAPGIYSLCGREYVLGQMREHVNGKYQWHNSSFPRYICVSIRLDFVTWEIIPAIDTLPTKVLRDSQIDQMRWRNTGNDVYIVNHAGIYTRGIIIGRRLVYCIVVCM